MRGPRLVAGVALALGMVATGCGGSGGQRAPLPDDFALTMERGHCYGPCPVYRVEVDAAGTVTYRGQDFVRVEAVRQSQVDPARLRVILETLTQAGFFALEDEYWYWGPGCEQLIADAQTVVLTVTLAGETHRLRHYYGCSGDPVLEDLIAAHLQIDRVLGTREWVFCSDEDSFFMTSCDDFIG